MFLTASALTLGFMHGLGADHLTAIAALSIGSRSETGVHPLRIAIRFALGHALLLAVGASLALTVGWTIPSVVERIGETVGGLMLIVLGAAGLWLAATLSADAHPAPTPWHRHHRVLAHTPVSVALGALFAISSLRALVLLAPFGQRVNATAASLALLVWLIAVFAAGIIISMSLFGIVLARVLSAAGRARAGRAAAVVTAVAAIGLGFYWISLRS